MLSIYYRTIKNGRITKLKRVKKGSWLDVVDPSKKEIRYLEKMGIDVSFIEDALDPDELPRIESEKGVVYLILNAPQLEGGEVLNLPFLIAVGKDFFITLSKRKLNWLNALLEKSYTTQRTKNLLEICLMVINLYTREIREINKKIILKKRNLSKLKNEDIIIMVKMEEILNDFITSIVMFIGIFEKILTEKHLEMFKRDKELIEDFIIDSKQSLDMCKTSIKKIVDIRGAYSTILGNELNRVMKVLASLTLIMGIPNIIASFYGMNVRLPGQNSPLAFISLFSLSLILSLTFILIFYLKRWIL